MSGHIYQKKISGKERLTYSNHAREWIDNAMTALLTTRGGPRTTCQRKRCYEEQGVGSIVEE